MAVVLLMGKISPIPTSVVDGPLEKCKASQKYIRYAGCAIAHVAVLLKTATRAGNLITFVGAS